MGQATDHAVGRSRRAFAKGETTFGTFAKPAATDAMKLVSPIKFDAKQVRDFRADNRSTRGRGTERITGKISVDWSMECYALPSGTAGTAPDIGEVLKRALGTETVTGGTKVDYTLSGVQALGSLSLVQVLHDGASTAVGIFSEAAFGAWVESMTIKLSGKEAPRFSFEGGAAKYANTGYSTLNGALSDGATSVTVQTADANLFQVGSVIKIGTSDNHEVTAVSGAVLTVSPGVSGAQSNGAAVTPTVLSETTGGSPISATLGSLTVDGATVPVTDFELTMKNNNKPFDDELGQTNVTDFIPGEREVSGSFTFRGRRDHLVHFANRWGLTTQKDLAITSGNTAGKRLKVNVDKAEFDFDALEIPDKEEVMVKIPFVAMEASGNDEFNLSFD